MTWLDVVFSWACSTVTLIPRGVYCHLPSALPKKMMIIRLIISIVVVIITMVNYYLFLRSIPYISASLTSMLNPIDWLSIMLGPDCWNYSPHELGFSDSPDERYGRFDRVSGLRYGVDPTLINHPAAQSLLYAVSGVGVHLCLSPCA